MRPPLIAFLSLTLLAGSPAIAEPLGEHPAVIAQRLSAKQGYDYAGKFYPHPAWLWLHAEAPRPMMDHPAVAIAKRQKQIAPQQALAGDPIPTRVFAAPASLQQ
jgi:hypothetical protein